MHYIIIIFLSFALTTHSWAVKPAPIISEEIQEAFSSYVEANTPRVFKELDDRKRPTIRGRTLSIEEYMSSQITYFLPYLENEDYTAVWKGYYPVKKEGIAPSLISKLAYLAKAYAITHLGTIFSEDGYAPSWIDLIAYRNRIVDALSKLSVDVPQGFFLSKNPALLGKEERRLQNYRRYASTHLGIILGDVYRRDLYPGETLPLGLAWTAFMKAASRKDISRSSKRENLIFKLHLMVESGHIPDNCSNVEEMRAFAKGLWDKYNGKKAHPQPKSDGDEYPGEDEEIALMDGLVEADQTAEPSAAAIMPALQEETRIEEQADVHPPHKGLFSGVLETVRERMQEIEAEMTTNSASQGVPAAATAAASQTAVSAAPLNSNAISSTAAIGDESLPIAEPADTPEYMDDSSSKASNPKKRDKRQILSDDEDATEAENDQHTSFGSKEPTEASATLEHMDDSSSKASNPKKRDKRQILSDDEDATEAESDQHIPKNPGLTSREPLRDFFKDYKKAHPDQKISIARGFDLLIENGLITEEQRKDKNLRSSLRKFLVRLEIFEMTETIHPFRPLMDKVFIDYEHEHPGTSMSVNFALDLLVTKKVLTIEQTKDPKLKSVVRIALNALEMFEKVVKEQLTSDIKAFLTNYKAHHPSQTLTISSAMDLLKTANHITEEKNKDESFKTQLMSFLTAHDMFEKTRQQNLTPAIRHFFAQYKQHHPGKMPGPSEAISLLLREKLITPEQSKRPAFYTSIGRLLIQLQTPKKGI